MPSTTWNPDTDIPSLAGKIILITGGTSGLGSNAIVEFAKHSPDHIVFTGRNQQAADALIEKVSKDNPSVQLTFIKCEISSFDSVREVAKAFKSQFDKLDILMLNAGIMARPPGLSKDGYEIQFATNFLGHALLMKLLMPILESTAAEPDADVRIIQLSSIAYTTAPSEGIKLSTLKTDQEGLGPFNMLGHRWARYGQSKLAQLVYAKELAKHHPSITSVAVHPGVIYGTNLWEDLPGWTRVPVSLISRLRGWRVPLEQGHWNQVWAATCPKDQLKNGAFYAPFCQLTKTTTRPANDEKLAEQLWEWTEEEIAGAVKGQ
ncbi:uncharacterized protein MYCFIDRAFT_85133 [Pseudocercospora fijiensis CIRAD86]|uniref:Oxidoreductase n=1 Tax=Pseudocercospora fijiensis (strain CIRAD86) TaxID=383855 RepID=M3ABG0_PSEFD|nr:uncharacterized protein MYCFIDRAFT_85133 [Pseudocercospora fijiensis CIRAD86]EME81921.1 hypothetical protein MYCFIDRAFT_85133 [Pseudocercospora fijiensis CIRAD86]